MKLGTLLKIDESIINNAKKREKRSHLGASVVGDPCMRKIWYQFYEPIEITDPRILRIFKLGQVIEDEIVIPMLRDAGFTVYEKDNNGDQFGFKDGKFAGSIDGCIVGLPESSKPHLLEIKSANKSRFNDFKKNGYRSSSTYYAQIQIYMKYMKLERALVVVYCKDDSELYLERIKYDSMYAEMQVDKAYRILESKDNIPDREFKRSTDWRCRFCQHKEKCWEE